MKKKYNNSNQLITIQINYVEYDLCHVNYNLTDINIILAI